MHQYYLEWNNLEAYDAALKRGGYTQGVKTVFTDANMEALAEILINVGTRGSSGGGSRK